MSTERLDEVIQHERRDHGVDLLAPIGFLAGMAMIILALYSALVI
jgi:hypothetical protein